VGHGRVDPPPDQLQLDGVAVGPDVEELESEPPRATAGLVEDTGPVLRGRPVVVHLLERRGKPVEVPTGERRDPPPDTEGAGTLWARQLEGDATGEGPLERGVATVAAPQTESPCRFVEVQVEAVRRGVEAGHDPAQEPGRRRTYDWQPELLDVPGPGIVAEGVDDGIGPRNDGKGVRTVGRGADTRRNVSGIVTG